MQFKSLGLVVATLLLMSCASSVKLSEKSRGELLIGGEVGVTLLSEYPSQAAAPRGIAALDGRILQCYNTGSARMQIEGPEQDPVESIAVYMTVQLLFFSADGVLIAPPYHPNATLLLVNLKPTSVGIRKDIQPSDIRTPEMEFGADNATLLLRSLLAGGAVSPIASIRVPEKVAFDGAYLYIGPTVVAFLFTGDSPILVAGEPSAN